MLTNKTMLAFSTLTSKILFLCICIVNPLYSAHAEQVSFTKKLVDEHYQFDYQWHDHREKLQSISFSLPQKNIFNRYRNFAIYQPKLAQDYINKKLKKHFKKYPVKGVQLSFVEDDGVLQVNFRGQNEKLIEETSKKISLLQQGFAQEYLTLKFYHQFTSPQQIMAIKPDHVRIATESVGDLKALKPIILEQSSIKNIRKVTNYVLGFVQSIPYSTLESRITSSGAGFSPPLKLLWENQGDCDSKVTLAVSLLRTLMPRVKMALIFIDNHALLGINIPAEGDDIAVIENDINYVLAEPTGPAILSLGNIAEESAQAIYNGHYTLEAYHAKNKTKKSPAKNENIEVKEL